VPHIEIASQVCGGPMEERKLAAIKSRLLTRLRDAHYDFIAESIRHEPGNYGLFFKGEIKMIESAI
jgi:hypothetical protein